MISMIISSEMVKNAMAEALKPDGFKQYWLTGYIRLARERHGQEVWVLRDACGGLIGHYANDFSELMDILKAHGHG